MRELVAARRHDRRIGGLRRITQARPVRLLTQRQAAACVFGACAAMSVAPARPTFERGKSRKAKTPEHAPCASGLKQKGNVHVLSQAHPRRAYRPRRGLFNGAAFAQQGDADARMAQIEKRFKEATRTATAADARRAQPECRASPRISTGSTRTRRLCHARRDQGRRRRRDGRR